MTVRVFRPHADDTSKHDLIGDFECESVDHSTNTLTMSGVIADVREGDLIMEVVQAREPPSLPYYNAQTDRGDA